MSKLRSALREKFATPKDALAALGLDADLLDVVVGDSKDRQMDEIVLAAKPPATDAAKPKDYTQLFARHQRANSTPEQNRARESVGELERHMQRSPGERKSARAAAANKPAARTPEQSIKDVEGALQRKRGGGSGGKTKHDTGTGRFTSDSGAQDMKTKLSIAGAMTQGALVSYLAPKLAQDAKIDLAPVVAGITAKNLKAGVPKVVAAVQKATKGKLAQDMEIDTKDLEKVLEVIETLAPEGAAAVDDLSTEPNGGAPMSDPDNDGDDDLRAMLKAKGLSDDEIERICGMGGAADESDDDEKAKREKREAKEAADKKAKDASMKDMVDKKAMDAAITSAVKVATDAANETQRAIRDAERSVRPYVGEIKIACDSAEKVFRTALDILGVKGADTVHASALQTILEMQPLPGARNTSKRDIAMDASATDSFAKRYPDAAHIRAL